jgi:cysteine-rich repeat protein
MLRFTILLGSVASFMPSCPCYGPEFVCEDSWGDGGGDDDSHGDDDTGAGVCGDGIVDPGEECDDGGTVSGDRCSATCMIDACTWDVAQHTFPIVVWQGQAVYGQIAFDGDCDLIVSGGEETSNVYRVDKDDGTVSIVAPHIHYQVVSALTYRASDDRVYYTTGLNEPPELLATLYALDNQEQVHEVLTFADTVTSLTVAPEGFGGFGGQLIGTTRPAPDVSTLQAIDVETGVITTFAQSNIGFGMAAFGPDGALYVTGWNSDSIVTVTADGVITPFYTGISNPSGLAVAPDGSRMFVAHQDDPVWSGADYIDEISIPGATLTPRVEIEQGFAGSLVGIVVDGANHVLYEVPDMPDTDQARAIIDMFAAP